MPCVMIVDSDPFQCRRLESTVLTIGYRCVVMTNGRQALEYLIRNTKPEPDVLLLDVCVAESDGIGIIRRLRDSHSALPVIALCTPETIRHCLLAIKVGAYDFIHKPTTAERLEITIVNALRTHQFSCVGDARQPSKECSLWTSAYPGFSEAWRQVVHQARRAANRDEALVIEGEKGVGKLTLARAIHHQGKRAGHPFVLADARQDGLMLNSAMERAEGGTLVIHHVDRASESFLLQLQTRRGRMRERNVRLILCRQNPPAAAARRAADDPPESIAIPPLRERRQDIPLLAARFLQPAAALLGREPVRLSLAAQGTIKKYGWPGNLRQLHAELFDLLLHHKGAELPSPDCCHFSPAQKTNHHISVTDANGGLRSFEEIESEIINFALRHYNASRSDIARMLGIGRTTLYRKVNQFCA